MAIVKAKLLPGLDLKADGTSEFEGTRFFSGHLIHIGPAYRIFVAASGDMRHGV